MTVTMYSLNRTTAARIDVIRKLRGITQRELSEVLGISQTNISARLKGRVAFNLDEIDEIAAMLDVSIAYLMGIENSPSPYDGYLEARPERFELPTF